MYEVLIERQVERDIRRLPKAIQVRVAREAIRLGDNPRPAGCRKLVGSENDWRIRIGDYRVVYEIDDARKSVRIFRVRHRKDAYK